MSKILHEFISSFNFGRKGVQEERDLYVLIYGCNTYKRIIRVKVSAPVASKGISRNMWKINFKSQETNQYEDIDATFCHKAELIFR